MDNQTYSTYLDLPILARSTQDNMGVLTVGVVSEKPDTYNTIIDPEGCDTPVQSIVVDFRHLNLNTGSKVLRQYIRYVRANPDGSIELNESPTQGHIKTLIFDIGIPKSAQLFIKDKNGQTISDGNAYEAVKEGRIGYVSVEFDPRPYPEFTLTDANGRTTYKKWRCLCVTLLDEPPSQDMAFIINKQNFRTANSTNKSNNMAFKQHDPVVVKKDDTRTVCRVSQLDENENKEMSYRCRTANGEEMVATALDMEAPNHDELVDYTRALHAKMAGDEGAKSTKREAEVEAPTEEKPAENTPPVEPELPAPATTEQPIETPSENPVGSETRAKEPKNDDTKADTELFKQLIKPLADKIDQIVADLAELKQKEKSEDEPNTRSVNPALIAVDPIKANPETESRGLNQPANLSEDGGAKKSVDEIIQQKIKSKIY